MMLKKTECKKRKKLDALKKKVSSLKEDIESIVSEHDSYTFESEKDALEWFQSFPIETLSESLARDRGEPRSKPSLQDFDSKSKLKKGYNSSIAKLEKAFIDLNVANIDYLLDKINKALERNESGEKEKV